MGAGYLAEQIAVGNRLVALEVLLRQRLDDPDFLRRFQDEAASTSRIHHPDVVTIYESGQGDDGKPYITMEYLETEPLGQALKTRGALPVAECAEILQQAARGLNAAYKLGIIHRGLMPHSIFLTHSDDVGATLVGTPHVVGHNLSQRSQEVRPAFDSNCQGGSRPVPIRSGTIPTARRVLAQPGGDGAFPCSPRSRRLLPQNSRTCGAGMHIAK